MSNSRRNLIYVFALIVKLKKCSFENLVKNVSQTIVCKNLQLPPRLSFAKCFCVIFGFDLIFFLFVTQETVSSSSLKISIREENMKTKP